MQTPAALIKERRLVQWNVILVILRGELGARTQIRDVPRTVQPNMMTR